MQRQKDAQDFLATLDNMVDHPPSQELAILFNLPPHLSQPAFLLEESIERNDIPENVPPLFARPHPEELRSTQFSMPSREMLSLAQLDVWQGSAQALDPTTLDTGAQTLVKPVLGLRPAHHSPLANSSSAEQLHGIATSIPLAVRTILDRDSVAKNLEVQGFIEPHGPPPSNFIEGRVTGWSQSPPQPQDDILSFLPPNAPGESPESLLKSPISDQSSSLIGEERGEMGSGRGKNDFGSNQQDSPMAEEARPPSAFRIKLPEPSAVTANSVASSPTSLVIDDIGRGSIPVTVVDQSGRHSDQIPIITQLTNRMYVAMQDGHHELRISLTPENLGTVRVEIVVNQGNMQARLQVETPLVKEVIEENLSKLKESLQTQGLRLTDLSVSVGQHFLQHESTTWRPPFIARRWRVSEDLIADSSSRPMTEISTMGQLFTGSLRVDLFA